MNERHTKSDLSDFSGNGDGTVDPRQYATEPRDVPPPGLSRSQRRIVRGVILLVLLPVGWSAIRTEIGFWYAADSQRALINGEITRSVRLLDKALEWDPDNLGHTIERCSRKLQTGDADWALADSDHALRLARAAAADQLTSDSVSNLVAALNLRAYAYALAEESLEEALENVEEAFDILGQETNAAMLDTRAYLKYLLGDYEGGLMDAERAVDLKERQLRYDRHSLLRHRMDQLDTKLLEFKDRQLDEMMAVYYQHRGLLYDAVGRSEEATKDLERAEQLGFNPENGVW